MATKSSIAIKEAQKSAELDLRLEAMEKSIASLKRELNKLKKTEQDK
jgi:hypothetical protein